MRAKDFLRENDSASYDDAGSGAGTHPDTNRRKGKRGQIHPDHESAIPGMVTIPDWPGQYYNMYRLGVHMAGSPHNAPPHHGMASNEMVITQFSDADTEIIKHSAKELGVPLKAITSKGSRETKEVNHQSPINKPKKNRYGV